MRRHLLALAVAVCSLAPAASAGTPVWLQTFPSSVGYESEVDSVSTGTVVAVVAGTVVVSRDRGVTWSPVTALPAGTSSQSNVTLTSDKRWFAESGAVVSTSNDGGATWAPLRMPRVISPAHESWEYATDIGSAEGKPNVVVGWTGARVRGLCPYALTFTPLFTSHDAGAHWRRTDLPVPGYVFSATWLDAKHAAVVVLELEWSEPEGDDQECGSEGRWTGNSVWTTADGGVTWRRALRTQEWYMAAAWASPTSVVAIGDSSGTGRAYVSYDSGRTFRTPLPVWSNPGPDGKRLNGFPSLEFVGGRRGWLGTIFSGIYRTDSGGSEWSHETSVADGDFDGVPDITVLDGEHAVFVGPRAVVTRYGEVGAAGPGSVARRAFPSSVAPFVETVRQGAFTSSLVRPAYGPPSVTLRVAPGA